jgi:hypothetical protein
MDDKHGRAAPRPRARRTDRLAAELRANLKRRKAQARARAAPPQSEEPSKDSDTEEA